MNYAMIKNYDIANGTGVRVSLFVSGCNHHCKGCFNQETWDFNYGQPFTKDTIKEIIEFLLPNYINGLSILGGEPLDPANIESVYNLVLAVKNMYKDNKNIWLYTGYTWEELMKRHRKVTINNLNQTSVIESLLKNVDILIDGRFVESEKDISLIFRGSRNQRIIDCKKSLDDSINNFVFNTVYTYPDSYFKR